MQGPTELLPVSSSGHTTLIPWLAGRAYPRLDPQLRKAFEVALHAGAGLALALDMREELLREIRRARSARRAGDRAVTGAAGRVRVRVRARRSSDGSGGHGRSSLGLVAGAMAMVLADARGPCAAPPRGRRRGWAHRAARSAEDARRPTALRWGSPSWRCSRQRARRALTAARARGFARTDAARAVLARGAAGDPGRERAEGVAAGAGTAHAGRPRRTLRAASAQAGERSPRHAAARPARRRRRGVAGGRRERLRLDARERARAAPRARACPPVVALRALPLCAGGRRGDSVSAPSAARSRRASPRGRCQRARADLRGPPEARGGCPPAQCARSTATISTRFSVPLKSSGLRV